MASVQDLYRYDILSTDSSGREPRPVAQHGMGSVYRALDLLRNEVVALKVVSVEMFQVQASQARRTFMAEATAGARLGLESPHIVRVFDVGQIEDILYLAQEWMTGGNIVSQCGEVTLFVARTIALQVGAGVQVAHRHGIVHSDICPANILYDAQGGLYKLSDFGLLKLMHDASISVAGGSDFMTGGRRAYLPKEHFSNPDEINASSDVYALAVTFYALLTGELPPKDEDGRYSIPGAIGIKGEHNRKVPFRVNRLLDEFVVRRSDKHSIDQLLTAISQIPV